MPFFNYFILLLSSRGYFHQELLAGSEGEDLTCFSPSKSCNWLLWQWGLSTPYPRGESPIRKHCQGGTRMDSQLVTRDDWGSRGGYLLGGNGSILASTIGGCGKPVRAFWEAKCCHWVERVWFGISRPGMFCILRISNQVEILVNYDRLCHLGQTLPWWFLAGEGAQVPHQPYRNIAGILRG